MPSLLHLLLLLLATSSPSTPTATINPTHQEATLMAQPVHPSHGAHPPIKTSSPFQLGTGRRIGMDARNPSLKVTNPIAADSHNTFTEHTHRPH